MSSFAFGMILIAAGFVAYLVNHALKPEGWSVPQAKKPQPACIKNKATDFAIHHGSIIRENQRKSVASKFLTDPVTNYAAAFA